MAEKDTFAFNCTFNCTNENVSAKVNANVAFAMANHVKKTDNARIICISYIARWKGSLKMY